MKISFNQDTVTEFYENEIYENGKVEGMIRVFADMVKKSVVSVKTAV